MPLEKGCIHPDQSQETLEGMGLAGAAPVALVQPLAQEQVLNSSGVRALLEKQCPRSSWGLVQPQQGLRMRRERERRAS